MYMHSLLFVWGQNQNSWLSFSNFLCLGVKCVVNCTLIALILTDFVKLSSPEEEKYGNIYYDAKFIRSKCLVWLLGMDRTC